MSGKRTENGSKNATSRKYARRTVQTFITQFCRRKTKKKEVIILGDDASDDKVLELEKDSRKEEYGMTLNEKEMQQNIQLEISESRTLDDKDEQTVNIKCPICNLNIGNLDLTQRNEHVNDCLFTVTTLTNSTKYVSVKKGKKRSRTDKKTAKKEEKCKKKQKQKRRPKPALPDYKVLPLGKDKIAVDAFCFEPDNTIQTYILTHFHSDHYGGLRKSWDNGSLIIGTKVTVALAVKHFNIPVDKFMGMEYNESRMIPNTHVEITCLDANHCPGSAIFVLESKTTGEKFLHCGDFRANGKMVKALRNWGKFDRIYIDDTYLDPQYSFPKQVDVIDATCNVILNGSQEAQSTQKRVIDFFRKVGDAPSEFLVVVGTYSIGKERLAIELAERMKSRIYCDERKGNILKMLQWKQLDDILETNPANAHACKVHLVSMRAMNKDSLLLYLKQYSSHFKTIIGINPTGWSFGFSKANKKRALTGFEGIDSFLNEFIDPVPLSEVYDEIKKQFSFRNKQERAQDLVVGKTLRVPYSEHSSFRELFYFINLVPASKIIPTVNVSNLDEERWVRSFQKYDGKLDVEKM